MLFKIIYIMFFVICFEALALSQNIKQKITKLVKNNSSQMIFKEYSAIAETIVKKKPCNLLVFGTGKDSKLWVELNKNGNTVFLEDSKKWLNYAKTKNPKLKGYLVKYVTKRPQWKKLLKSGIPKLNLDESIKNTKWDIIIVDAPIGFSNACPGRMQSIFTASLLANANKAKKTDVFVHDCHRKVEKVYTDIFLLPKNLAKQVYHLRHYIIN